jgi:hypothetical protein
MNTKKENKNAYRQMKFRAGIFQIKNLKDNKSFINTSTDLDRAFNSDLFQLKLGSHRNTELQNDWNTIGPDNFELSILDELKLKETITDLEKQTDLKELLELHRADLLKKGIKLY